MLKVYCDICGKEPQENDFVCEMTIMEMKEVFDLTKNNPNLNPRPQMKKRQLQICRKCFEDNINKLIKYGDK